MRPQVVEQNALSSGEVIEDERWAYKLSGIMSPDHSECDGREFVYD